MATTLSYDGVSRLSGLSHQLFGTAQDVTWTYTRNAASQLATAVRSNDAYAWTAHYAVNRPYTTNGLNQYSAAGTAEFLYDANGNLTTDGNNTYTYDIENRLVSMNGVLTLTYDPLGRLYQTAGGTSGTTRYLYDGDALVAEYNAAGTLLRRYVHGVGADVPLVWYEGATLATRRHLYADHQGSIVAVGQPDALALAVNAYDEYGIPAAANDGLFQYTGQIWLRDLGLYHYKARVYSPTLGRFLQVDPVGYDDQFNLYVYLRDDPVNNTDPTGKCLENCPGSYTSIGNAEQIRQGDRLGAEIAVAGVYEASGLRDAVQTVRDLASGDWRSAASSAREAAVSIVTRGLSRAVQRVSRATCCFVAGTLVDTADGLRSIESIRAGDLVLSRNHFTGETAFKPVTELILRHQRVIWRMALVYPGQTDENVIDSFGTTDDHPWRDANGEWIQTADLRPGMKILRANGAPAQVIWIIRTDELTTTYNLEVADFHTYFVGEARVWVHNTCRGSSEYSRAQRRDILQRNRDENDGRLTCEGDCRRDDLQSGVPNRSGEPTPQNQAQVHHDPPIYQGGGRQSDAYVLCPRCHKDEHRNLRGR